jgi:hypothetical protein
VSIDTGAYTVDTPWYTDERDANNMEKLPLRIFRSTFVFHGVVTTGNSIFTGYQKYPAKG